jgi:thiamine biosynthesis protein ThiI
VLRSRAIIRAPCQYTNGQVEKRPGLEARALGRRSSHRGYGSFPLADKAADIEHLLERMTTMRRDTIPQRCRVGRGAPNRSTHKPANMALGKSAGPNIVPRLTVPIVLHSFPPRRLPWAGGVKRPPPHPIYPQPPTGQLVKWQGVVVRYGEIGIKSAPVRRQMQARLRQNILDTMLAEGVEGNVMDMGARLWMVGGDIEALLDVACRTFGVVSASPSLKVGSAMDQIKVAAIHASQEAAQWTRFAVRARRQGTHGFSSHDVGVQVGSAIYVAAEAAGKAPVVDLDTPELEVMIDVRGEGAFISTHQHKGPGGLPLGTQGRAALLLSDTNSAVAAWLMMRRGCTVVPVHAGDMGSAPLELIEPLQRWGFGQKVTVLPVCTGAVTKAALLEAAAVVARSTKSLALVTGDTLDSDLRSGNMPVLRPTCGLDPAEVARIATMVGLPDEDGPDVLVAEGGDDAESLLRMRRVVDV